jgi:hypothetical protein
LIPEFSVASIVGLMFFLEEGEVRGTKPSMWCLSPEEKMLYSVLKRENKLQIRLELFTKGEMGINLLFPWSHLYSFMDTWS